MTMQVILLERVESLGQMGDVVNVRPGYARNFLLPRKKALRATKDNIAFFQAQKVQLEADNLKRRKEAEKVATKLDGLTVSIIRQASEGGQLYGSVSTRDISDAVTAAGVKIARDQVVLDRNFKLLGLFPVKVVLHPEVTVSITINIARSEEEAKVQKETGRALIAVEDEEDLSEKAIKAVEAEEKARLAAEEAEQAKKAAEAEETAKEEE